MLVPNDLARLPEKTRLLKLLQMRGQAGVFVYELIAPRPQGLGIAQYNRAIKELRDGKHDGIKHQIVNAKPGHFILKGDFVQPLMFQPNKSKRLDGTVKDAWESAGAYLRGEGPKPSLTNLIQEALI